MDFSAANATLWNPILQLAIIAAIIVLATLLRHKIPFIRRSLIPTAVLGGFILLALRATGVLRVDVSFLEAITYHGIALGFIALSLRVPKPEDKGAHGRLVGLKSGAIIVSSYLIQAFFGLLITLGLAYTVMPGLFKAAGILLPMGFGQGPGQANNVGSTYEASFGFVGGRSFGLAIAAAGYLCACIVGVVYLNILVKKGKVRRTTYDEISGSVNIDTFQDKGEIPIAESLDKLSMQVALVLVVYGVTYLATWGIVSLLEAVAPGLAATVSGILWGFNFMIGSLLAMALRSAFARLRKGKLMTRQYQNNYLLSRLSGLAFDIMIVAGIGSIDIGDLSGMWVPFILLTVTGAVVTFLHLRFTCKRVYKGYYHEGFVSMYGMMTGTISSGILLLRELDADLATPAANNLVAGSGFAIALGAPLLVLIGMAPKSDAMTFLVLGLVVVYYVALMGVIFIRGKAEKKSAKVEKETADIG
ncbi:MAG: hypothetical protein VB092_06395 [Oscillospiraceae bacterium]|nr:hypothetical protein [Oscillospiraceae bacterium]